MTRGGEHLRDLFLEIILITVSVMIHFFSCVKQFKADVSHDLMFSVSLVLRRENYLTSVI